MTICLQSQYNLLRLRISFLGEGAKMVAMYVQTTKPKLRGLDNSGSNMFKQVIGSTLPGM